MPYDIFLKVSPFSEWETLVLMALCVVRYNTSIHKCKDYLSENVHHIVVSAPTTSVVTLELCVCVGVYTSISRDLVELRYSIPIPVAAGLLGLLVRISPGHGYLSLASVVCCQVAVSAPGRSLVQRTATECDVSVCNPRNLIKQAA
jgi:hypothetical protein